LKILKRSSLEEGQTTITLSTRTKTPTIVEEGQTTITLSTRTKTPTLVDKTLHKKLNIEQYEPY